MHPSLRPAGDWVSMHPNLSACIREIAVAGCLSILSFQQFSRGRYTCRSSASTKSLPNDVMGICCVEQKRRSIVDD
jgi:hypothetical protein